MVVQDAAGTQLLDTAVASVASVNPLELARRMYEPGRPGREQAKVKYRRYGPTVSPIIMEDTGRLHITATRMLRQMVMNTMDPGKELREITAEFQAVMLAASMHAQRAARGVARA